MCSDQNNNNNSKSQPSFCFLVILLVLWLMSLTLRPKLFPLWIAILPAPFFLCPSAPQISPPALSCEPHHEHSAIPEQFTDTLFFSI